MSKYSVCVLMCGPRIPASFWHVRVHVGLYLSVCERTAPVKGKADR